jgi:DNA-binding LacI/PurR family transcriptional regulator
MAPRSRVTIRDVAKYVGVSHQTISRVINNSERVSPETREKVQAAIEELGYRPNAIARSMALGRTSLLACIAPNLTDYTFANIVEGAEAQARELGYFLISASAKNPADFSDAIEQLVASKRVTGLLVINPYIDTRYKLLPDSFPMVFVGSNSRERKISSVALDDYKTAYEATHYLIEQGHRNVAMITGPMIEDCSQDRCKGFEQAIRESGLGSDPTMIIEGDWSATSGHDALMRLAEVDQLPTAVFAQNDRMAIGVIQAARNLGLIIPKDISVIGVDDMPLASYFDPPLTTMKQDIIQIGKEAAKLLVKTIENPDSPKQIQNITAQLVVRNSTKSIRTN